MTDSIPVTLNGFVVCDPNWGEPFPIMATFSPTVQAAVNKAVRLPEVSLYSGASEFPKGSAGCWTKLKFHGYFVAEIRQSTYLHVGDQP